MRLCGRLPPRDRCRPEPETDDKQGRLLDTPPYISDPELALNQAASGRGCDQSGPEAVWLAGGWTQILIAEIEGEFSRTGSFDF